ncbi:thiolase family protein [Chloroflexota bacterium]
MSTSQKQQGRDVAVLGVGVHPFGRFPDKTFIGLSRVALDAALKDAGMEDTRDIQSLVYSHAMEQTLAAGLLVSYDFGMKGNAILGNMENACSSSSTALWLAKRLISTGIYDIMAVIGTEKMPPGAFEDPLKALPDRYLGVGLIMALYAMRTRRYMMEYGAPIEAIAQIPVKAHYWGKRNPMAQFKKEITIQDVLNSRVIADPITLFNASPTGEGSAALILCAADLASKYSSKPVIKIAGSSLVSEKYEGGRAESFPENTHRAGLEAFEQAGLEPKDIDLAELHDAASVAEILRAEALGLIPVGEGWKYTQQGETDRTGKIPLNISGGLKACGHPLGATGSRQIAELVWHLRGEAGERQVPNAKVGLAETAGFGGVDCVHILTRE